MSGRRLAAALAMTSMAGGATVSFPTNASAAPWQIERSDVLTLRSADGHDYRVMVAWPDGPPPPQGWPVLWLLDGEDNFAIATMTARRLAGARARSGVEEGVIVAIESGSLPRRILDYTPSVPGYAIPAGSPASGRPLGGGDAFLAFLRDEVRPQVTRRWKIDTGRETLMGHSFGGLLALHALAGGGFWSRYVAVSPSLWYGNGLVAREAAAMSTTPGKRVLMAGGDREGAPAGGSGSLGHVAATLSTHGIDAHAVVLAGQTHGSTMMAAMADGIALAFGQPERKDAK
nr:alpha/beta hydrolase-fold protein [Novosphingobium panipatense]